MKINFSIIILLLCLTIAASGQTLPDSLGFTNKAEAKDQLVNGLKEGKWCETLDEFGNISTDHAYPEQPYYRLTIYKAGKAYGIVREYYENWKLSGVYPYSNGKINGVVKWYYQNGALKGEATYIDGKENGTEKIYYEDGKLEKERTFTNGKEVGTEKWYYENGKLWKTFPGSNPPN